MATLRGVIAAVATPVADDGAPDVARATSSRAICSTTAATG